MASLQQVFFYKRYEKVDFVRDAVFENTLSESAKMRVGGSTLEADHSKLDVYLPEDLNAAAARGKKSTRRRSITDCLLSASSKSTRALNASTGFRSAQLTGDRRARSKRASSVDENLADAAAVAPAKGTEHKGKSHENNRVDKPPPVVV